jgi:hypothetical protein
MRAVFIFYLITVSVFIMDQLMGHEFIQWLVEQHFEQISEGFFFDYITATFLFMSFACFVAVLFLMRAPFKGRVVAQEKRACVLIAAGFLFGSVDEIFDLHCIFEHYEAIRFFERVLPFIYVLMTGAVIFISRDVLAMFRTSRKWIFSGFFFQFISLFGILSTEEIFEMTAAFCYLKFSVATLRHYFDDYTDKIRTGKDNKS